MRRIVSGGVGAVMLLTLMAGLTQAATTDYFIITVKTNNSGTSSATRFTIPTTGGGYNYDVDLQGLDTWEYTGITGSTTCAYSAAGTYTIRIRGTFPQIYFNNGGDRLKLISVEQWGTNHWTSMEGAFYGCANLVVNAGDVPDLSGVDSLASMFRGATSFNQDIGSWDTSHVTTFSNMFNGATSFNQPIGGWNTSWVTDMGAMFQNASAFNQPIGTWNMGNVTNIGVMFYNATAFNQPLSGWDVSRVTDMYRVFFQAVAFNQAIGGWDTKNVTSMSGMFYGATAFNQDISTWNTGKVTNMAEMFYNASAFNQPVGIWDTSKVTSMTVMFGNAAAFDQNVGSWNVTALTTAVNMFVNVALSTANYDALLNGWGAQIVNNGVTFGGGNSHYVDGAAMRAHLISDKGWLITDGGYVTPTSTFTVTPTVTPTATQTPTPTVTITPTITQTTTQTITSTITPMVTLTPTATVSPAITATLTQVPLDLGGKHVMAYPNPGKTSINIAVAASGPGHVKVDLYNLSGERVADLNAMADETGSPTVITWNCGTVAPGVYLVRAMQDGKEIGKTKVAVMH